MAELIVSESVGAAFESAIDAVCSRGEVVWTRGMETREIRNLTCTIEDPRTRFVAHSSVHYPTIALRQLLLLSNECDQDLVEKIACTDPEKSGAAFKYDDLNTIGLFRHICQVGETLKRDSGSRQAVLVLEPHSSIPGRVPITVAMQFFVRSGVLEASAFLRSNDLWNGLLTDVVMLGFVQEMVADYLGCEAGRFTHVMGSAHLYGEDLSRARDFISVGQPVARLLTPPETFHFGDCNDIRSLLSNIRDINMIPARPATATVSRGWFEWCERCIYDALTNSKRVSD